MAEPSGGRKAPLRVLVAMSGGVDSSIAAYLLHRAGHEVAGVTMKLFCYDREEGPPRPCCDLEAVREARRAAETIGIPHTVVDMEEAFRRDVVGDFIQEYAAARTPNPCVRCNTYVKFGPLLDKGRRMGFEAVATGHYARRGPDAGGWGLFRARDRAKDQSYVLWGLDASQLSSILFPLGRARKAAVRRLARRIGLPGWNRAESQDICFVPGGRHGRFVAERLSESHPMRRPGPVRRTADGVEVGRHEGLLGVTIGQRRGVGVGGGERLYVVALDPDTATLWVGPREATLARGLIALEGNLLAPPEQLTGDGVHAQIRYRQAPIPCRVLIDGDRWEVRFHVPEPAISPGQSVVFYSGDRVLGGGRIERAQGMHPLPGPLLDAEGAAIST
jgi:tRNA-specific 2-thiouridylase